MNENWVTVRGNLVEAPRLRQTKSGHQVANFRIGSNARRFDRDAQKWVDQAPFFINVAAWRTIGENAHASLKKGDPVVVYGRWLMKSYTGQDEKQRSSYEIEAVAIGHDLARGTTSFSKDVRPGPLTVEVDPQGMPIDASSAFNDYVDDGEPDVFEDEFGPGDTVDTVTGEVREMANVT